MIWYVDTSGFVSPVPPAGTSTPIVGPLYSIIDGTYHLTAGLSLEEIKDLRKITYQQIQLENHNDQPNRHRRYGRGRNI